MTYFATFFSHFGAMRYQQLCREQGIECRVMPVPPESQQQLRHLRAV